MWACAIETEGEDGQGEQEKTADVAAALVSLGCVVRRHGLLGGLVDEIVDAELEIGAVELLGQRWELAYAGDGTPSGAVEGLILCRAI